MSGSPDWKPGHSVRPSSASNRKMGTAAPSQTEISPSSNDMSGRYARKHPIGAKSQAAIFGGGIANFPTINSRADLEKATHESAVAGRAATNAGAKHSGKRPISEVTGDESENRRVQPRTAVFGDEVVHLSAPPLPTGVASPPGTPFVSGAPIFDPAIYGPPEVERISLTPGRSILPPRQFLCGQGPPFVPSPQAMWPGGMFKPGWHIGADFRCIMRQGLHHRVYEGPLDGTPRVRLGPEEITVDFSRPYRIRAMFCNHTFSAVQFKAPKSLMMNGMMKPGMMVWTNVRCGNDWWADLMLANMDDPLPVEDDESGEGSVMIKPRRRSISAPRIAPTVPAWNELDHDDLMVGQSSVP